MPARENRKLAAILAADVVGYSRLMERDEAGTLRRVKAARGEVIGPAVADFGGRIVKTIGDGLLIEFASAADAVQCALAIQGAMAEREAAEPAERRLSLRIGVNLGDVIVEDDDLYGDGVNVAARLEGIAPAGGLSISGTAHDTLRGDLAEAFADDGERRVKNIARPIRVFSWRPAGASAAPAPVPAGGGRKPSVALAAFEALGGDPDAGWLAGGVREAIVASTANVTGIAFMAEPDRADFVLAASFQVRGGRYRVVASLQDRADGRRFWSERLEGTTEDPFAAQDELATRIFGAMRYAIYNQVVERRGGVLPADADVETLLSEAGVMLLGSDAARWRQARGLIERILASEPDNFMAWAMKAVSYLHESLNGYRDIPAEDLAAAEAAAQRAVCLNGQSEAVHTILALVHLVGGDLAGARREAERALDLNAHSPMSLLFLGQAMIYGDAPEEGLSLTLRAAEVFKRMPLYYAGLELAALGHFVCGRYGEAMQWAERAQAQAPGLPRSLIVLASAAALAGDRAAAERHAGRLLAAHPEFSLAAFGRLPFADPERWERLLEGLRQAGVPED